MSKLTLLAPLLLLAASASAEMGLGAKVGSLPNDTQLELNLPSGVGSFDGEYEQKKIIYGGEVFYETDGMNRWGVSLGYENNPKSTYDKNINGAVSKYTYKTMAIPLTAYYKYVPDGSAFNFRAGGGISYMKVNYTSLNSASDYTQGKIVPHLDAGVEWRFARHFGLGLNLAYLFAAKFDNLKNDGDARAYLYDNTGNDPMKVDNTGARFDIALRCYF